MPLVQETVFATKPESPVDSSTHVVAGTVKKDLPIAKQSTKRFCDDSSAQLPCIFDIGLNTGQDTASYLAAPNARVVAVEANPTLIDSATEKFAPELREKRLTLVRVGLTNLKGAGQPTTAAKPGITFWVNTANNKFGSFVEHLGCRSERGALMPKGDHTYCRKIEIATKTCHELIREYGTPMYMKIDIEGMDQACFLSLKNVKREERPKYLSVENVFSWDIDALVQLGYTRFKIVNQAVLETSASEEMKGHSGPWGDEAVDQFIGKLWHTAAEAKARLPLQKLLLLVTRSARRGTICTPECNSIADYFRIGATFAQMCRQHFVPCLIFNVYATAVFLSYGRN